MWDQGGIQKEFDNEFVKKIDSVVTKILFAFNKAIPNFNSLSMSERVANGFDVPWVEKEKAIVPGVLMTLGFLFPCIVLANFSLKLRELETK